MAAKKTKLDGLRQRGVFEVEEISRLAPAPNIMPGRFVLARKQADTESPKAETLLFIQGFYSRDKGILIHTSYTVCASSIMLFVALACVLCMRLCGFEVTQAYLQSDT